MLRRIGLVLVWVVAAVAATGIVFAAVSSVAGDVVERPGPILEAALDEEEIPRQVGEGSVSTTSRPTTSLATTSPSTPSTASSPPSTSSASPSTTVTSTSGPTTSSPLVTGDTKTFRLVGGWVRVAHSSGVVTLDAAAPNSGFTMEVKQSGPDEVEVEFRGDGHRSSVEAQWVGGRLVDEIEERDD